MPTGLETRTFLVQASRPGGGTTFRLREAQSRAALAGDLRREHLLLVKALALPAWVGRGSATLPVKDQVVLNEQLGHLLARGVPLVEALEVVTGTVTPASRPVIELMRQRVSAGSSFADACRSTGVFDDVTVAVYRAAERTGDLAGSAKQLAVTARRAMALRGGALTMLAYPLVTLAVCFLVAFVMIVFIVPTMVDSLLQSDGANIPWFTRAMAATGSFINDFLPFFLLGFFGLVTLLIISRKAIAAVALRAMRAAPLFGPVLLAQESARFFSTLAAMTRSGVPLADALGTANQAIGHPRLRSQMERLRTRLVEGGVLRVLIDQVDALPLATRRLLIAAERSGDLDAAFNSLASDMTDEVERRSARLMALLQPVLIIFMFTVVGSIILSLLIPMINSTGQIGGP
ncbi:MAG: type II secretion system F family protein [Planctomyces sp.]